MSVLLSLREIAGGGQVVLEGFEALRSEALRSEALRSEAVFEAKQLPAGASELNPSLANVQRDNLTHLIAHPHHQAINTITLPN